MKRTIPISVLCIFVTACEPSAPAYEQVDLEELGLPMRRSSMLPITVTVGDKQFSIPWGSLTPFSQDDIIRSADRVSHVDIVVELPEFSLERLYRSPNHQGYLTLVLRSSFRVSAAGQDLEFAEKVNGFAGPIPWNGEFSYYEAGSRRYYVFADADYRRPDGSKPWMYCFPVTSNPEDPTTCSVNGGWLGDSVRIGYSLSSRHLANWPQIDRGLLDLTRSLLSE